MIIRRIVDNWQENLKKGIYSFAWNILKDEKKDIHYQERLKKFLKEKVLDKFLIPWLKNKGITVTQGILYINSIVILYDGRIAVYFGDKWNYDNKEKKNIKIEEWINRKIFSQENDRIEFLNILALCNRNKVKMPKGKFPVLVFGKNTLQYEGIKIEDYELANEPLDNIIKLYSRTDEIFSNKLETLNLFAKEFSEKYKIKINNELAKKLLLNPLRVANKYKAPNLFYIYDHRDVDDPGGIAFAATVDPTLNKNNIQKTLEKIQQCVCDYILTPILIAESQRLRRDLRERAGEKPYVFRFFNEEDDENKMETRIPLIYNIRNLKLQAKDVFSQKAKLVKKDLEKFFINVSGPSGKVMKDYSVFSEEIFLVILQIWDDLEITNIRIGRTNNKKIIKNIDDFRQARGKLQKNEKLLIDLLFTALNFEPAMRFIPSYREHFIHCFHTFSFGFWLMSLKNRDGQYLFASNYKDHRRLMLLKSWFLAGIFHDIGIPIQKAGDYLKALAELLVQPEELRLFPRWSDLMTNPYFHEFLFGDKFIKLGMGIVANKNEDISVGLLRLNHRSVQLLLEKAAHPVVGSLILYNNIKSHSSQYNDHSHLIDQVIMPVLVHHIWNDEWKKNGHNEGKDWSLINFKKYPIVYLLMLCDAISQLERRFEDADPDASTPAITLYKLVDPLVHREDKNQFYPECNLVYGVDSEVEARKYLKYYQGPINVICCGKKPILKVTISYNMDNPTSFGEPFMFKTP